MADDESIKLLNEYSKNTKWLFDQFEELSRKYPSEYVAVDGAQVAAHDLSLARLLDQLKSHYKDIRPIAIQYIPARVGKGGYDSLYCYGLSR